MDGVLPISLSLTDNSARLIGAYLRSGLVDVVRPSLDRIDRHLLDLRDTLRMLSIDVVDIFKGVTDRRLKVQVMNEELLDHIEATRWAVAYFSYNTFLELLEIVRHMNWLNGRSHLHLHDIINILYDIENLLGSFASVMFSMGDTVVALLQMIIGQLSQGIGLTGTIQIIVTGAEPLKDLNLLKLLGLLGLLALGLTIIVAFLFGVGAALGTFTAGAILAAGAVVLLAGGLIPLINTLVKFKVTDFVKIGSAFALIAGFVAGLGKAFQLLTTDLGKVIPHLDAFFVSITNLMNMLVKFKVTDFVKIGSAFALIAVFVAGLGKAFQLLTTDLGKVIPHLDAFFVSITNLMKALAKFKLGEMITIAAGFLLIAGFVWLLVTALDTLSLKAIYALEPLGQFFAAITALMIAISKFTPGEMFQIAVGFILIAGFVWLLSMAINTLTLQSVVAVSGLAALITALTTLAGTLGHMTVGEMVTMTIGLLLIAGFVWLIAAALVYAAGPLASLATMFEKFGSILEKVSGIADGLSGLLKGIDFKDILGGIGGFLFGGPIGGISGFLLSRTIGQAGSGEGTAAGGGAIAAALPPASATAAGAAPPGIGALGPGGALAAAPAGGPATVDQTVNAGGINITITADRLEADSARLLTDDIVAQLQARLGALRATQDFQAGARPAVA